MSDWHGRVSASQGELPLLRFRDGDADGFFHVPVTILGRIVGVGDDVVTFAVGRGHTTMLYVEDLYALLGGPEAALGILVDAGAHDDMVTIHLGHDRITYENPAQLARYRA